MLYGFVIAIHVVSCIILIGVILLQAGRGGGLSETFGGEASQTIFGTKVSVFLTKATIVAAALYLVTCLSLGIMTTKRGRSLIDLKGKRTAPITIPKALPLGGAPVESEGTPLAEPEKLPAE